MGKEHKEGWVNTKNSLSCINLNTHHLKNDIIVTLMHEIAHFHNYKNGIKDCSSNQYHNKHFKKSAEMLLLNVERFLNRGYCLTTRTEEFNNLLKEFGYNEKVFNVVQNITEKDNKQKSRLYLYVCDCGVKVRCGLKELKANCNLCNSEFKR